MRDGGERCVVDRADSRALRRRDIGYAKELHVDGNRNAGPKGWSSRASTRCQMSKLVCFFWFQVQWYSHALNANTYFPSTIGYIASGLMNQNTEGPHFNDRSFLNTLEWRILWKAMDDYYKRFGNVVPDETRDDIKSALDEYRRLFDDLLDSYFYKRFRRMMNGIAIIDSNTDRCDALRQARREGSDLERSSWRFYTFMQNLMYSRLYPSSHIDVAWFDDHEMDTVTASIAAWLKSLLDRLVESVASNVRVPLVKFKLPVPKHDFCLSNISTHSYRSRGRLACKIAVNPSEAPTLANYIPSYVDVYESIVTTRSDSPRFLDSRALERPSDTTKLINSISRPVESSSRSTTRVATDDDDESPADVSFADAFDDDESIVCE